MPRLAPRAVAIPLAMLFAAWASGAALAQDPVTVTDADGNDVVIADASRVATLGGVVTEIDGLGTFVDPPNLLGLINMIARILGYSELPEAFFYAVKSIIDIALEVDSMIGTDGDIRLGDILGLGTDNVTDLVNCKVWVSVNLQQVILPQVYTITKRVQQKSIINDQRL